MSDVHCNDVITVFGGDVAADSPLDAYSRIVAGVAAELTGKVASLRVPRRPDGGGGESLGSAVVYVGRVRVGRVRVGQPTRRMPTQAGQLDVGQTAWVGHPLRGTRARSRNFAAVSDLCPYAVT